jgi:N-methylhydantoinase A
VRVAIDTGGTFTDFVYLQDGSLRALKVRSTPANPDHAVLAGLESIGVGEGLSLRHGTTVGTNAMLEGKGARVAFVTTEGFEDTIAIGRQTRPRLYDWFAPAPVCLVPPELRFGVPERVSAEGKLLREPTEDELAALAERVRRSGAEAIAISLLFAFLRPENELRVEAVLRPLGLPLSTSHRILPEFREYERASTIVVNAYLAPRMGSYLMELEKRVGERHGGSVRPSDQILPLRAQLAGDPGRSPGTPVEVMQSSGGIVAARLAAEEPVRTVLSGPAGGVIGAWRLARQSGFDRILGFDMGGTSTDVFLADAEAGGPQLSGESKVGGVPVSVPMLDIHSAGAGGGSLARFDAGGLLQVGPESAGADPGPICVGRGTEPTVTDANLLLGRIGAGGFLDGAIALDAERTRERFEACRGPLASAEAFAEGILRVVESGMERAIRVVSEERGHDPRRFALVAFGGGGPLHACALARALHIGTVVVPPLPGALSAVGILLADSVRDISRTVMLLGDAMDGLEETFLALEETLRGDRREAAAGPANFERSIDVRYRGQGYELNVPYGPDAAEAFHRLHQRRFGFCDRGRQLEIVTLRVRLRLPGPEFAPAPQAEIEGDGKDARAGERPVYFDRVWRETPIYARERLRPGDRISGPALVIEYSSTTVLPPGCHLRVDGYGALVIDMATEAGRDGGREVGPEVEHG